MPLLPLVRLPLVCLPLVRLPLVRLPLVHPMAASHHGPGPFHEFIR